MCVLTGFFRIGYQINYSFVANCLILRSHQIPLLSLSSNNECHSRVERVLWEIYFARRFYFYNRCVELFIVGFPDIGKQTLCNTVTYFR